MTDPELIQSIIELAEEVEKAIEEDRVADAKVNLKDIRKKVDTLLDRF